MSRDLLLKDPQAVLLQVILQPVVLRLQAILMQCLRRDHHLREIPQQAVLLLHLQVIQLPAAPQVAQAVQEALCLQSSSRC